MNHVKDWQTFITEGIMAQTEPEMLSSLSCPKCNIVLDTDFYKTAPIPRECVGCGENIEEILNRKPWAWA